MRPIFSFAPILLFEFILYCTRGMPCISPPILVDSPSGNRSHFYALEEAKVLCGTAFALAFAMDFTIGVLTQKFGKNFVIRKIIVILQSKIIIINF